MFENLISARPAATYCKLGRLVAEIATADPQSAQNLSDGFARPAFEVSTLEILRAIKAEFPARKFHSSPLYKHRAGTCCCPPVAS